MFSELHWIGVRNRNFLSAVSAGQVHPCSDVGTAPGPAVGRVEAAAESPHLGRDLPDVGSRGYAFRERGEIAFSKLKAL